MMRIILLLLVALTGPFCTFTSASTLVAPTAFDLNVTATVEPDQPTVTEKTEKPSALPTVVSVSEVTEVSATAENTSVVTIHIQSTVSEAENTTDPTTSTESDTETEEPVYPTVIQEIPTTIQENNNTAIAEKDVEIEEAMGTGQLVGIVIGALIAVIVVIAVIILVVRRMGQYSP